MNPLKMPFTRLCVRVVRIPFGRGWAAGKLTSLLLVWAAAPVLADDKAEQVELYHWVDFEVQAPEAASGIERWDVEGQCVWKHEDGQAQRTSLMWYAGEGDRYVFRFGASYQGRWTGVTSSPVEELDGLEFTVEVTEPENPDRTGWSGQMAEDPQAWARQAGPDGKLARQTPVLIMMPDVDRWYDTPEQMQEHVGTFHEEHGFNGGHISTVGRNWFEIDASGSLSDVPETPDVRTFEAIETAAGAWSERGGWLHIWMWGKGEDQDFTLLPGGYDGEASQRLNRYVAARLGPVPGWSMGIGWDVEFWIGRDQIAWWLDDLGSQFGGWHHWLGARYSGSDIGEGVDPEPANRGEYRPRGIEWNTIRPGNQQYAGWEHWRTETSDEAIDEFTRVFPDRPLMSEDRFRRRDDAWPQKDFSSSDQVPEEIERWASRGVAAIYGRFLENAQSEGSEPFPNKEQIRAVIEEVQAEEEKTGE